MALNVVSAYPEGGSRRHPILFVHGAWHGAWCWERFMEWFPARGWECHAVDLRGHGDSPSDRSMRRTRIRHYVEDLTATVEAMERPPIIVAHSMGGLVAQRFLEGRWLPGAVLLASVPIGGVWRATARTARRHPGKFVKANLTLDLGTLVEDPGIAADLLLADDQPADAVASITGRLQKESYFAYIDMLFMTRPRPPLVPTPVGVVAGSADRIFSVNEQERLARAYGADLALIDEAGHDLMLDPRWEQAASAIADICDRY